jgi:predicted DCC family thiol-disulfide oxidoreductase YuxK
LPIKVADSSSDHVMTKVTPPVIVYDGDCGFCTSSIRWAQARISRLPATQPFQFADLEKLGITRQACEQAVQFVDADGSVHTGDRAVARALMVSGAHWRVLGQLMSAPGVRTVSAMAYRLIARHRHRLPGSSPACDTGR